MSNLEYWGKRNKPPREALKEIKGGRLGGMTDINPQWRLMAITDIFGPVGKGWYYDVLLKEEKELESGEILCFVDINLFVKYEDSWSKPVFGTGGSKLVTKEQRGLHASDEGYKMALTDALSVAMKAIGIGADIYLGAWNGSKYKDVPVENKPDPRTKVTHWIAKATKEIKSAEGVAAWRTQNTKTVLNFITDKGELGKLKNHLDNMFPSIVNCPDSGKKMNINDCINTDSKCKDGCPAIAKFRGE
jgi:hypothetical protein